MNKYLFFLGLSVLVFTWRNSDWKVTLGVAVFLLLIAAINKQTKE